MNMKIILGVLSITGSLGGIGAHAADTGLKCPPADFKYCAQGSFADCTQATCSLNNGVYSCNCPVKGGFSVTSGSCVAATATTVQSRYAPIASYQQCNVPPKPLWAWCLSKSCTTEPNSTTATCTCSAPPAPTTPYIVATGTYLPKGCSGDPIYSSATVEDATCIAEFLQKYQRNVTPPIVIQPPK